MASPRNADAESGISGMQTMLERIFRIVNVQERFVRFNFTKRCGFFALDEGSGRWIGVWKGGFSGYKE